MALKDIFSRFAGQQTVNLKQPTAQQRQMVIDLFQQTERLTQKDVANWRMAWQRAIDVENPKRLMLYNVQSIPDFFLIDRGNNIVTRAANIKDLEAEIKKLL